MLSITTNWQNTSQGVLYAQTAHYTMQINLKPNGCDVHAFLTRDPFNSKFQKKEEMTWEEKENQDAILRLAKEAAIAMVMEMEFPELKEKEQNL